MAKNRLTIILLTCWQKNELPVLECASWKNDLECRFCDDKILESQEHLKECRGLSWERRNLRMDTEGGKINFFKRMEKKIG